MDYIKSGEAEKAKKVLEFYVENYLHPLNKTLAYQVINHENFALWSGSSKPHQHHYGNGGLIVHTEEVVTLCVTINQSMVYGVDKDLLFFAALYHDVGKIWDYQPVMDPNMNIPVATGDWTGTDHKTKIYHIQRSALIWNEYAKGYLPQEQIDEVLHAILAHHGQPDWGSPVRPATKIAWLLHLCDNMSARMCDNGAMK